MECSTKKNALIHFAEELMGHISHHYISLHTLLGWSWICLHLFPSIFSYIFILFTFSKICKTNIFKLVPGLWKSLGFPNHFIWNTLVIVIRNWILWVGFMSFANRKTFQKENNNQLLFSFLYIFVQLWLQILPACQYACIFRDSFTPNLPWINSISQGWLWPKENWMGHNWAKECCHVQSLYALSNVSTCDYDIFKKPKLRKILQLDGLSPRFWIFTNFYTTMY